MPRAATCPGFCYRASERIAMTSSNRPLLAAGALLGGLGVLLGAFGAHALRSTLSAEAAGWWQTAVQYQTWHALALVALSAAPLARPRIPALLMCAGTIIFSGSLYLMALTGARWLGAITPIGGTMMIVGWFVLACFAGFGSRSPDP
jgi:uncharacterized membrane protein YgdD (TMEM256/DUF423 family)